jgi:hypothetical protein
MLRLHEVKFGGRSTDSQAKCLSLQSAERQICLSMATFCSPPGLGACCGAIRPQDKPLKMLPYHDGPAGRRTSLATLGQGRMDTPARTCPATAGRRLEPGFRVAEIARRDSASGMRPRASPVRRAKKALAACPERGRLMRSSAVLLPESRDLMPGGPAAGIQRSEPRPRASGRRPGNARRAGRPSPLPSPYSRLSVCPSACVEVGRQGR